MSIGGYAKLSVLYSDTDKGALPTGLPRDIYLPSATPVAPSGATVQDSQVLDFTARESRINFKGKTDIDGHKVGMTLEIDFLGTSNGNEIVSNSYSPRLRHFFFTFDEWLFGQTWSTAMDTAALAESVDFLAELPIRTLAAIQEVGQIVRVVGCEHADPRTRPQALDQRTAAALLLATGAAALMIAGALLWGLGAAPLVAGVSVPGLLAVGLALQGSLQNFASGALLVLFKPIAKGEFVEIAGPWTRYLSNATLSNTGAGVELFCP